MFILVGGYLFRKTTKIEFCCANTEYLCNKHDCYEEYTTTLDLFIWF